MEARSQPPRDSGGRSTDERRSGCHTRFSSGDDPEPPREPKAFDLSVFSQRLDLRLAPGPPLLGPNVLAAIHASRPAPNLTIRISEGGNELHVHVNRLKHSLPIGLDSLWIRFRAGAPMRPFTVSYRLTAAELLEPVEGTLHVISREP